MKNPDRYYDRKEVRVKDLTAEEKDQLLESILHHLGRELYVSWWSDDPQDRSVGLENPRR